VYPVGVVDQHLPDGLSRLGLGGFGRSRNKNNDQPPPQRSIAMSSGAIPIASTNKIFGLNPKTDTQS
jgi:hypothetical protein